jgi:hypothetical protein
MYLYSLQIKGDSHKKKKKKKKKVDEDILIDHNVTTQYGYARPQVHHHI